MPHSRRKSKLHILSVIPWPERLTSSGCSQGKLPSLCLCTLQKVTPQSHNRSIIYSILCTYTFVLYVVCYCMYVLLSALQFLSVSNEDKGIARVLLFNRQLVLFLLKDLVTYQTWGVKGRERGDKEDKVRNDGTEDPADPNRGNHSFTREVRRELLLQLQGQFTHTPLLID